MIHAIRIGIERASNPYPLRKADIKRGVEEKKKFCLEMESGAISILLVEVVARTTNRLVGNPREMPTRNPLGTKGRNPIESNSIKGREVTMNRRTNKVKSKKETKNQRTKEN